MKLSDLKRLWRSFCYHLYHASRGGGKPVPAEVLDNEYRSGRWNFFAQESELPRYQTVVGHIRALCDNPSVLDLGCGDGRLAHLLAQSGIHDYHGVDLSEAGLTRARSLGLKDARFEQADLEQWRPARNYDAIVFNESVGYLHNPSHITRELSRHLSPGGALVISLYRWGNFVEIWRGIEQHLTVLDQRQLRSEQGQVWDVKLLRPKNPCQLRYEEGTHR